MALFSKAPSGDSGNVSLPNPKRPSGSAIALSIQQTMGMKGGRLMSVTDSYSTREKQSHPGRSYPRLLLTACPCHLAACIAFVPVHKLKLAMIAVAMAVLACYLLPLYPMRTTFYCILSGVLTVAAVMATRLGARSGWTLVSLLARRSAKPWASTKFSESVNYR